jgi:hypothetical protein
LNSGPPACQASALPLEPHPQHFFALVIFQVGSHIVLMRPALDLEDLPLPPMQMALQVQASKPTLFFDIGSC